MIEKHASQTYKKFQRIYSTQNIRFNAIVISVTSINMHLNNVNVIAEGKKEF